MTTDVFHRVVWKEYRMLRGFWIALAAFVLVVQFIVWMNAVQDADGLQGVMLVAVVLYALGAASAVFAVEREEGTDAFLQSLPGQSGQLFLGKVAFVVASTIALAAALSLLTAIWHWTGLVVRARRPDEHSTVVWSFTAAAVAVFVCGLFCSLVFKRPLVAACLAAVGAWATFFIANVAESATVRPYDWPGAVKNAGAIALTVQFVIIFAIDIYLGRRWLRNLDFALLSLWAQRRRAARATVSIARTPAGFSVVTAFWRLAWQEFRQARRMMLIFIAIGTLLAIWTASFFTAREAGAFAFPIAITIVAVMGGCVFLSDQERSQFRFFAERPVRPRLVWLNRQFVWLAVIGLSLAAGVPIWVDSVYERQPFLLERSGFGIEADNLAHMTSFTGGLFELPNFATFAVFAVLAYACGQLCSMAFRSGIIAGFMGAILAGAVSFWAALMGELGVDWRLAIAPIPFFLLFATWLRAPHWIGERSGPWPWSRFAMSLVVPALGIGIVTATYRVLQIPLVEPGFSPAEYAAQVTPEARETAAIYERASAMIDETVWNEQLDAWKDNKEPAEEEAQKAWNAAWKADCERVETLWLQANREPLKLALAATERPDCVFTMAVDPQDRQNRGGRAAMLIAADAHYRQREGDLDGALDSEMALLRMSVHLRRHQFVTAQGDQLEWQVLWELRNSWATRPGQTPERIRTCIMALDEWYKTVPLPSDAIEARYLWFEKLLGLDPDALSTEASCNEYFKSRMNVLLFTAYLMPWEHVRATRVLDYLTSRELTSLRAIEAAIDAGRPTSLLVLRAPNNAKDPLLRTTPLLGAIAAGRFRSPAREYQWVDRETDRQQTRLLLALVGWQIEHGALPESLDALAGSYFDELPRDPWSGRSFRYFPRGMGQGPGIRDPENPAISADRLVIWSCGPGLVAGNEEEAQHWFVDVPAAGRQALRNLPPVVRETLFFRIDNGGLHTEALSLEAALPRGRWMTIPKPDTSGER